MTPKGFGVLCGIETPNIDKLLRFVEKCTGKKYIDDKGGLADSEAVKQCRLPQSYGFKNVDDVLKAFA